MPRGEAGYSVLSTGQVWADEGGMPVVLADSGLCRGFKREAHHAICFSIMN